MKQASYHSVWCLLRGVVTWKAEVVERYLLPFKVKLICFVDTLMTLTSVNIKSALLFFLLGQIQALARSIMLTIHEWRVCDCVLPGIDTFALSPWGGNALLTDGRSSLKHHRFPLGDPSWAALLLVCNLQVSCEVSCTACVESISFPACAPFRNVKADLDVWPCSRTFHSRSDANVGLVCG